MNFHNTVFSFLREIFNTVLISLAIFLLINVFLIQPHRVKGDSMIPNFFDGELLLTEKVTYRLYKPERGDVIVFKAPVGQDVDFIKRIIGLPGDHFEIKGGAIFINGEELEEPYINSETSGNIELTLKKDQYFMLGDNREASSDSRRFGSIEKKAIVGKAWLVYWPLFKNQRSLGVRRISNIDYGIPDTFYDR